jgi:hypothetical protein
MAMVIFGGTFLAGLTFDIGLNAMQNWYDIVYADAFWNSRVTDSPALREVAKEELEIDRLMRGQDFAVEPVRRERTASSLLPHTRQSDAQK